LPPDGSLCQLTLQRRDLPERFRESFSQDAYATAAYPDVRGAVYIGSGFAQDDGALQRALSKGDLSSGPLGDSYYIANLGHTLWIHCSVMKLRSAFEAHATFDRWYVSEEPQRAFVLLGDGETIEDHRKTWVEKDARNLPPLRLGSSSRGEIRSVAKLDWDAAGDLYRSNRELYRETTEEYAFVAGPYLVVVSRTAVTTGGRLPDDVDLLSLADAVYDRVAAR
jgi:hypothetical protein